MSPHFTRRSAGWRENVGAALVAGGVGAAVFYLTRLLLAREPLLPPTPYSGREIGEGDADAVGRAALLAEGGRHEQG